MLKQRILTALILAPLAIACVFFLPPLGFSIFILVVLGIASWEWANLAGFDGYQRYGYGLLLICLMIASNFLPAFPILLAGAFWWCLALMLMLNYPKTAGYVPKKPTLAKLTIGSIGLFVLLPVFTALETLKQFSDSNFLILLLFFLIWGADVGAYFSGRRFGKHKLAPQVSPGKTWEGFWGGVVFSSLIAAVMVYWLGKPLLFSLDGALFILFCALIVMVSVLGDLIESMFKRNRGIKDSSKLLPGHGGILDRVDSLLSAGPLFAMLIMLMDWK